MRGIEALKTNARLVDHKEDIAAKIIEKVSEAGWILASEGYYDGIDIDTIKLVETDTEQLWQVCGSCTMGDFFIDVGKFNMIKTMFFQALLDSEGNVLSLKAA